MELDMDAAYTAKGMRGVALRLVGWATEEHEMLVPLCEHEDDDHDDDCEFMVETETVERDDMVRAVMVGDDVEHLVDVDDLTMIGDEDFCGGCGQTGCAWGAA